MTCTTLKFFAEAKNSVSEIVSDLLYLLNESRKCASEVMLIDGSVVARDEEIIICSLSEKVKGIYDILQRNSMKVVFFGRTSNGKSTVINAMLRDKILPSALGHTTNCFVQVEGVDGMEAYIVTEDGRKQSVQSLNHLASALSSVKLNPESLIKIHWPKQKCRLLHEDVVIVDSPGIDVSADVDEWIDKFCVDADVFVLVANAESTLMLTEKKFFHKVSSKLSKPNIFILNNRWDASAHEIDTKKQVRRQHVNRCTSFLVDELQVITVEEVNSRVFFVSALDTLNLSNPRHVPNQQGYQPSEGVEERLDEFLKFEKCFEDCISRTAVETKFSQHSKNVESVSLTLVEMWTDVGVKIEEARNLRLKEFEELSHQLSTIRNDFVQWQEFAKDSISEASQLLKTKLSQSLSKELKYLHNILDEYARPFDPDDEETMRLYKKDLNFYVEENLCKNLHVSYTPIARSTFMNTCENMIVPASSMLSTTEDVLTRILSPIKNFDLSYNLNCTGLCSRFIEDVDFKFSLGFNALVGRCFGREKARTYEMEQLLASSTSSSSLLPFTSKSTIGFIILLYAVSRMAGPRVLGICASTYGALYAYERLTWTNKMKEQSFKRQYVSYVSQQLKNIMDMLSLNCSQQVERELNSVLRDLQDMIMKHQDFLRNEIQESDGVVKKMENISASVASFRSGFLSISKRLEEFQMNYLKKEI